MSRPRHFGLLIALSWWRRAGACHRYVWGSASPYWYHRSASPCSVAMDHVVLLSSRHTFTKQTGSRGDISSSIFVKRLFPSSATFIPFNLIPCSSQLNSISLKHNEAGWLLARPNYLLLLHHTLLRSTPGCAESSLHPWAQMPKDSMFLSHVILADFAPALIQIAFAGSGWLGNAMSRITLLWRDTSRPPALTSLLCSAAMCESQDRWNVSEVVSVGRRHSLRVVMLHFCNAAPETWNSSSHQGFPASLIIQNKIESMPSRASSKVRQAKPAC